MRQNGPRHPATAPPERASRARPARVAPHRWLAGLALLALLLPGRAGAENAPDPTVRVVEEVHAALLAAMREADVLGFEGRRERLEPVLRERFDFPFMASKSVGRHWRELDPTQRERLVSAFADLAIATYAARFSDFDGERFETLGREEASHDTVMVKTRIVPGSGEEVPLDYRLRQDEQGRWRIIDVFLNGTVSELALRRSEYSSVIEREGFPALLSALGDKTSQQAAASN